MIITDFGLRSSLGKRVGSVVCAASTTSDVSSGIMFATETALHTLYRRSLDQAPRGLPHALLQRQDDRT